MRRAMGLLLAIFPALAGAQQTGWEALGRTLGHREEPQVPLVPSTLSGLQASKKYGACLEKKAVEFAQLDQDTASVVAAAKGACRGERSEFYSAVYEDERSNGARHNSAIHYTNGLFGRYEADVDAGLPGFVISARKNIAKPSAVATDRYSRIAQLKALLESGALTPEEFADEKAKILAEQTPASSK